MPYTVADRVQKWSLEAASDDDFNEIHAQIDYHAHRHYEQYMPTVGPHPDFSVRLRDWLDSAEHEEDQKSLLRLLPHIFFVASEEFAALYRCAMRGPISRWLIDLASIEFTDPSLEQKLRRAVSGTWFCPVTDSMQIAAFYHANNIKGVDLRPDWHSLAKLGSYDRIGDYLAARKLRQLVLLEDFVGSGGQMLSSVEFVASSFPDINILLVPLIICPEGVRTGAKLARRFPNLTFCPVLSLPPNQLVVRMSGSGEPAIFAQVRDLAERLHGRVKGSHGTKHGRPRNPFGYNQTGCLVVMSSNCPNNSLPIIHHSSDTWRALFPRSSRT